MCVVLSAMNDSRVRRAEQFHEHGYYLKGKGQRSVDDASSRKRHKRRFERCEWCAMLRHPLALKVCKRG